MLHTGLVRHKAEGRRQKAEGRSQKAEQIIVLRILDICSKHLGISSNNGNGYQ